MTSPLDLARAETAPFTPGPEHQTLARFAGSWKGPTELWLDPDAPPEESTTELLAEPILGGRWLRLSERGAAFGKPHAGEMLLGYHLDARAYELAWVDSSHTGTSNARLLCLASSGVPLRMLRWVCGYRPVSSEARDGPQG